MIKTVFTLVGLVLLLSGCGTPHRQSSGEARHNPASATSAVCPPPGQWVLAGESRPLNTADFLDAIAQAEVILLGERHDNIDEHRWQLYLLAALQGRHRDIAVGFEMFTREQQPVLDRWSDGELSEAEFLEQVDWSETWGYPAELYAPLLHFVRLNRIDSIALNIDRALLQRISREGWDAVPPSERYQIQPAVPGPPEYDALLDEILRTHHHGPEAMSEERQLSFRRAQQAWDRAMAEAIADATEDHEGPLVGLVGRGHMEWGYGIPYQLAAMGIDNVVSLLPYREGEPCLDAAVAPADGLFRLPPEPAGSAAP